MSTLGRQRTQTTVIQVYSCFTTTKSQVSKPTCSCVCRGMKRNQWKRWTKKNITHWWYSCTAINPLRIYIYIHIYMYTYTHSYSHKYMHDEQCWKSTGLPKRKGYDTPFYFWYWLLGWLTEFLGSTSVLWWQHLWERNGPLVSYVLPNPSAWTRSWLQTTFTVNLFWIKVKCSWKTLWENNSFSSCNDFEANWWPSIRFSWTLISPQKLENSQQLFLV